MKQEKERALSNMKFRELVQKTIGGVENLGEGVEHKGPVEWWWVLKGRHCWCLWVKLKQSVVVTVWDQLPYCFLWWTGSPYLFPCLSGQSLVTHVCLVVLHLFLSFIVIQIKIKAKNYFWSLNFESLDTLVTQVSKMSLWSLKFDIVGHFGHWG